MLLRPQWDVANRVAASVKYTVYGRGPPLVSRPTAAFASLSAGGVTVQYSNRAGGLKLGINNPNAVGDVRPLPAGRSPASNCRWVPLAAAGRFLLERFLNAIGSAVESQEVSLHCVACNATMAAALNSYKCLEVLFRRTALAVPRLMKHVLC